MKAKSSRGVSRTNLQWGVVLAATVLANFPIILSAQTVAGRWVTYNEQTGSPLSVVEIVQSGTSIEGRIRQLFLEPYQGDDPVCSKCPGERRNQKVIGMNFLWGFKKKGNARGEGKILDPESGRVYSAKLWLTSPNTLQVRGYAGPLDLFYRTQTWRRRGTAANPSPVGLWETIDDHWNQTKSIVEIREDDDELIGVVHKIFLLPHEGTDPVCTACKGDLKNVKVVGMRFMWDFIREGDTWVSGKILDPGNGNIYASTIWLIDGDTLKVRGYLGPFYRTQVWRRLN